MIVAAAGTMFIMFMMMFVHCLYFFHQFCFQILGSLDGIQDILTFQLSPWCCDDSSLLIMLTDQCHTGGQLFFRNLIGSA